MGSPDISSGTPSQPSFIPPVTRPRRDGITSTTPPSNKLLKVSVAAQNVSKGIISLGASRVESGSINPVLREAVPPSNLNRNWGVVDVHATTFEKAKPGSSSSSEKIVGSKRSLEELKPLEDAIKQLSKMKRKSLDESNINKMLEEVNQTSMTMQGINLDNFLSENPHLKTINSTMVYIPKNTIAGQSKAVILNLTTKELHIPIQGGKRVEPVGAGAYKVVRLAWNINSGKVDVVWKIKIEKDGDLKKLQKEIATAKELAGCKNIASISDYAEYTGKNEIPKVIGTSPYYSGGDLLQSLNFWMQPQEIQNKMWTQSLDALQFMHENNIVHRDIKPQNIMRDNDNNARVIDFGMASKMNDQTSLSTMSGTKHYIPPEVLATGFSKFFGLVPSDWTWKVKDPGKGDNFGLGVTMLVTYAKDTDYDSLKQFLATYDRLFDDYHNNGNETSLTSAIKVRQEGIAQLAKQLFSNNIIKENIYSAIIGLTQEDPEKRLSESQAKAIINQTPSPREKR